MSSKTVWISDARYHNVMTGEVTTSSTYHLYADSPCVKSIKQLLEVTEDTAQAFGRKPCKICQNALDKAQQLREIQRLLHENALPSLEGWVRILPDEFELRLYHHSPDKKSPTKLWSSDLEV